MDGVDRVPATIAPSAVRLPRPIRNALFARMRVHEEKRCSILAVMDVDPSEVHQYGIVAGERSGDRCFRVTDLVEKPSADRAPSRSAIIGR
jgi:UTP--glucose-1-phosphate uridylyltransferase